MRHRLPFTAVASALALTAACTGGGGDQDSSSPPADSGRLAYAKCMRDNGVDVPDPKGGGNLEIPTGTPQSVLETAERACSRHLRLGGERGGGPDLGNAEQKAMLAYASCMRAQGRDFPDPVFKNGSAVQLGDGETPIDITSPEYRAADEACRAQLRQSGMEPPE